jgi:multisubunit Na+/H+ antiporter MnhF subunit
MFGGIVGFVSSAKDKTGPRARVIALNCIKLLLLFIITILSRISKDDFYAK